MIPPVDDRDVIRDALHVVEEVGTQEDRGRPDSMRRM